VRINLTLTKVPREDRDKFRALSSPETYFEIRPGVVGERVAYSVEMTDAEYVRALRDAEDPASNLIAAEPDANDSPNSVPGGAALNYLAASGLVQDGFDGRGVDVGVIDDGLSRTVADRVFAGRIKAIRGYRVLEDGSMEETDGYGNYAHGTRMASLAVPPKARLVFGASHHYNRAAAARLLYWMVDEVGVRVVSMSFGGTSVSTVLHDALRHARSKNILLFGSRGNENSTLLNYPGSYAEVDAISAYDTRTDAKSSYSSYGDVFAASVGDVVCWYTETGAEECTPSANGSGGTSAATALATRIAASLFSKSWSAGVVRDHMATKARRTGASPMFEGNGVLQAGAVVNEVKRAKPRRKAIEGQPIDAKGRPVDEAGNLLDGTGAGAKPLKDGCLA
jgi:hypothetical protein